MGICGSWFCVEVIEFKGHENIRATHRTTIEITREESVTPRGDCIIGVKASKGLRDFSERFKELSRRPGSKISVLIVDSRGNSELITGSGDPGLSFEDPDKIIIRKSSYIAPNTVMIHASKAACDLSRNLIKSLRDGGEAIAVFAVVLPKEKLVLSEEEINVGGGLEKILNSTE